MGPTKDPALEDPQPLEPSEKQFARAAMLRWRDLAEELKADVNEFNVHHIVAGFSQAAPDLFRVSNFTTGLQLTITAEFEVRIIRYGYEQVSDKNAGVPDGGILSMRQSQRGEVDFYSADKRLTSEETRKVLLEPVLLPPEMAA